MRRGTVHALLARGMPGGRFAVRVRIYWEILREYTLNVICYVLNVYLYFYRRLNI